MALMRGRTAIDHEVCLVQGFVQGWLACGRGRTPGYARDSGRYWEIVHIQGAGVGWGGVVWVGMRWMVRLGGPNLPSLIELHTHQP